jgi:SulP family sulfate permease
MDVTKVVAGKGNKAIILRMENVTAMDATALHSFEKFINICERKNIAVLISKIKEQPLSVLKKSGVYEKIGEDNFLQQQKMQLNTLKKLPNKAQEIFNYFLSFLL